MEIQQDLEILEKRYQELVVKLASPGISSNERAELAKESSRLEALISLKKELLEVLKSMDDVSSVAKSADAELLELCHAELEELALRKSDLESRIQDILFPPDPRDGRPAYLEIRAGAGGQEASLFVSDLLKMYGNFALSKGWEFSINDISPTEVGGYREVIVYVKGKDVYKMLKNESGVHRVQRVPKTEAAGRIHTSTVTVAVIPEADDVDVEINPADLRVDVFRASGAGGQHVNTTDSAVRITHIPTGIVVSCQQERSQQKNKAKALKQLRAKLLQAKLEKLESEQVEIRKRQIGSGDRSEKIRTYNYPQNRVTDHRIGLTLKKLDAVMQGDIGEIVDALVAEERRLRTSDKK